MARQKVIQTIKGAIAAKLKDTPEQTTVVGPLVEFLVSVGWDLGQIIFGKSEWRIPKSPSQATRREKKQSFDGFPVDIAVFDSRERVSDPRRLLFIIECKQLNETAGISQLEAYFVGEPHAKLGIWANHPDSSASAVFLYRQQDRALLKRRKVNDIPRPGEAIKPESERLTFNDLIAPTEIILKRTVEDLLDKVVITDSNVTRREEQLDQLCNLFLLKLESDKQGKADLLSAVFFGQWNHTLAPPRPCAAVFNSSLICIQRSSRRRRIPLYGSTMRQSRHVLRSFRG
jgi:type I restriction enzyme M protein